VLEEERDLVDALKVAKPSKSEAAKLSTAKDDGDLMLISNPVLPVLTTEMKNEQDKTMLKMSQSMPTS
jgi:hypothetical protein